MDDKQELMHEAVNLAIESIDKGGGPFGAVIVRNGKIVGKGHNQVTLKNDPTAHAEVMAIRDACSNLETFDLSGCEIFTSCEPCPMCLSAIYWAHIDKVYYAGTKDEAEKAGFDDAFIYRELSLPINERSILFEQTLKEEGFTSFKKWIEFDGKTKY